MNYVGQEIIHKGKYGKGRIIAQDEKYISVSFDSSNEPIKFVYPECFKRFLQLVDTEAAQRAEKENVRRDAVKEEEAKKKREEFQARMVNRMIEAKHSSRSEKSINMPRFSSVSEFCDYQERLLLAEISYLRKNGGKRIKLYDGELVEVRNSFYLYSFESESELNLPDNTQISLWLGDNKESIPAVVLNSEDFTVLIVTTKNLGKTVSLIEFSAESWKLLQYLIDRLKNLREDPSEIVKALICDGYKNIQYGKPLAKGQDTACQMSLSQPITFIWGPPGTGKTETLARIALKHLERGHRVLMLSYSNVSVDGAIWRVFNKDEKKKAGKLVRYGYPRDKELLKHEYLTSYNLTLRNHPDLLKERAALVEEAKHTDRSSSRYVLIRRHLAQIKEMLNAEEKNAVGTAAFVATTVSKAMADGTLYDSSFDTVIFDEASMAYIPQIVFSAGLAGKHFICMGDFSQLPPIVQSDSSNALNADIFRYCGIVDAVEEGYGHAWLCMLDTQYRMHPKIADFASRTMYHGLLKSGPGMDEKRYDIVNVEPFSKEVLRLVDLSGMMSVCIKTADQSRINVLSAIVAMGLAVKAAKHHEVGIITPYNAQSRLLHALSRDVMEKDPEIKRITCATVHQFQGSEKDVIIYDAVDCYRMQYPGTLLTSMTNDYANRLYNVAVTRARGKMISIANVDYMEAKNFSKSLIFRNMMDSLKQRHKVTYGDSILNEINSEIIKVFDSKTSQVIFLQDICSAKKEIHIDIPGGTSGDNSFFYSMVSAINEVKKRGVKVFIRTDDKQLLPESIRAIVIQNSYISDPIALIDKAIVWYGMPSSNATFISEGYKIPTRVRPIVRIEGKYFNQALYGFLGVNLTVDASVPMISDEGRYDTFAAYVAGEIKCPKCGNAMRLKKSKKNRFFMACSNYPECEYTQYVEPKTVKDYFYLYDKYGKRCPRDNTTLFAGVGRTGLYICCGGNEKHFFNLDEV